MKRLSAPNSEAGYASLLTPRTLELLTRCFSASELEHLLRDWRLWGRAEQIPPVGGWRRWIFMGGRGAGKTRAGAEWVSGEARTGRFGRIALIAPTFHDVREVMVEGQSGIRGLLHARPAYEPSRRRLVWPNGAQAQCFSAEDPDSLRGPQFDAAWCDEVCFWRHPERALDTLEHALRLGEKPRMLVTTTPRPIAALKQMLAAPDTVVTRSSTWQNHHNVAADFIAALNERWRGSPRMRQELLGELIEDLDGALWTRAQLEACRGTPEGALERIVVAVDPPSSIGANADACGIIAAGAREEGRARLAYILADATVRGAAPDVWAKRAAEIAEAVGAQCIVAESNNGGEMVRSVLKAAAPDVFVRLVRASDGKRARAEPIAAIYAQGRVRHVAHFPDLEDEMCSFGADGFTRSPDRLDALVWALTDLFSGAASPRVRIL